MLQKFFLKHPISLITDLLFVIPSTTLDFLDVSISVTIDSVSLFGSMFISHTVSSSLIACVPSFSVVSLSTDFRNGSSLLS